MKYQQKELLVFLSFWSGMFNKPDGVAHVDLEWRDELLRLAQQAIDYGFTSYEELSLAVSGDQSTMITRGHPINQIVIKWLINNEDLFPMRIADSIKQIKHHYRDFMPPP